MERAALYPPKTWKATVWLLGLTVVGSVAGWLMVFSSSYPFSIALKGSPYFFAYRQLWFTFIGLGLFTLACYCPLSWLSRWGWLIHLISMFLLSLTILSGGNEVKRWLAFGHIQLQPSEFAKVTLVLALASLFQLARKFPIKRCILVWLSAIAMWVMTVILVLIQPHLSGAFLLLIIGFFTLLFTRLNIAVWLFAVLVTSLLGYSLKDNFLLEYQKERLKHIPAVGKSIWWKHYQSRQAFIALKMGGLFGRGLFQSRQKHLFLPSAYNDFVFAIIGEELGFLGVTFVLAFFCLIIYWGLWVTARVSDNFTAAVIGGLTMTIWVQAMMHISVSIGLLPPTGIPLPFFSSGGSSLLSTFIVMGLLVNAARQVHYKKESKQPLGDFRGRDWWAHLSSYSYRYRSPNETA